MKKKHILVTNDDGVHAPSLLALVKAMRMLGKVTVLAPDRNWSAAGHVKSMNRPLFVREVSLADGSPALATDGAPSDCVALAKMGIVPESIDLVVSGINPNANLGDDVTYSGTVTAAMEAVINGMMGVAFSMDSAPHGELPDFDMAAAHAQAIAARVLAEGLPGDILLNVNIPFQPSIAVKGIKVTYQGKRVYKDELICYQDPHGNPFYWIGGERPGGVHQEGSDYSVLDEGYISITPLHLDLTARHFMNTLKGWNL
ncbi:MAG: 5'/3'-nucleotidase SurE [Anaerolineae bacterium]|nr:5'/3'-nucleotidase SurE [Anaerolineae bacterium]